MASAAVLKEMWFCPRSVAWRQYLAMIHVVGQIQACDACTLHAHRVRFMRRNPVGSAALRRAVLLLVFALVRNGKVKCGAHPLRCHPALLLGHDVLARLAITSDLRLCEAYTPRPQVNRERRST